MVDNNVDSARQLSVSEMKNLKRFINIEIARPQGPAAEYAGAHRMYVYELSVLVCKCVYCIYCSIFIFIVRICVYSSVCVRIAFIILDQYVFSCCSAEIMGTVNMLTAHAKCILSVFGKKPNGSPTVRVRIRFRTI